jgi:hypothetical protein
MEGKKFSTPLANVEVKNGIVCSTFLPIEITVEQMQTHVRTMKQELQEMKSFLALIDISQANKSINNKPIREVLNDKELDDMVAAMALVANSIFVRMAGNLFFRFSKRVKPISFFSTEAEALKWLEQYR